MSPARIVAAGSEAIAEAAALIRAGGLVAFPTETVYGLGADAMNARAVAAIFAAKNRPRFNPLICHVLDAEQAGRFARMEGRAGALAGRFWPGPLTLVLPRRCEAPLALLATAGLDTVAIRVPDHPVARQLIEASGVAIAAPSANRSGGLSPTRPEHVAAGLGERIDLILDGGPCRIGLESTIIDLRGPRPVLLRPGGVPVEAIEAAIGAVDRLAGAAVEPVRAPGMLSRHYAPDRPLRLEARTKQPGEALLGFGATAGADLDLSAAGDLEEAAANLFSMLRALDRPGVAAIAVAPIPHEGLGLAINDRLRRAAAPACDAPEAARSESQDWSGDRGPAAPCVLPDESNHGP